MSSTITHTQRIAKLNDQFRQSVQMTLFGQEALSGLVVFTSGVANLDPEIQLDIIATVRSYDYFTPDNDPYGEHDFGSLTHSTAGKIFWKIDYYEGSNMQYGASDPADVQNTFRVLTIMLASEY